MARTIAGMTELVTYILKDRGANDDRTGIITFSDEDVEQEISACVYQFSQDLPRSITADVSGTGSRYYKLTALNNWVDGYSTLRSIEFPAIDPDAVDQTLAPTYLDIDEFTGDIRRYRKGADDYIVTHNFAPTDDQTLRIEFTTPYALTAVEVECTIPLNSWDAVGYLVASRLCRRMAAFSANSVDATISSVAGEFRDSNHRWIKTAEEFENQYRTHVGLPLVHNGRVQTKVASIPVERNANWNTYPSGAGDWFNYSNRRR